MDGVTYTVWAYLPDNTIVKVTWDVVVPPYTYQYSSPSVNGTWHGAPPSVNLNFIDNLGDNVTYNCPLF